MDYISAIPDTVDPHRYLIKSLSALMVCLLLEVISESSKPIKHKNIMNLEKKKEAKIH